MYETVSPEEILSQGDVIDDCPLITIRIWPPDPGPAVLSETWTIRVVVLTQACDLAQDKTTRVVVAPVHEATALVAQNILKAGAIRDQVRRGQVFGWYFLPATPAPIRLAEPIVDLRELHTIERRTLEYLAGAGKRVCRMRTPGASTWPSISALLTRGLPYPNRTPRSRDYPESGSSVEDVSSG